MELYIHIPFCIRKCTYCAFDSFTGRTRSEMERYTSALIREASFRKQYITEPVNTVYIGGGTPSLLPADLLETLLTSLNKSIGLSAVCEFTIEANPGTVNKNWLDTALNCGINRISFGVQAAQENLLQTLGRIHSFDEAVRSVNTARSCGFQNINMDLIFGIPGQTMADWILTLQKITALKPEHISAYGLIPEEGTPLYQYLQKGCLSLPDPDLEREMYDTAINTLEKSGFHQYEISNFALSGYECRHNIGYWDQIPYLGLGLSAASMIRHPDQESDLFSVRWTNPSVFDDYYEIIGNPLRLKKIMEPIHVAEARFETVMLSLRMNEGMRRSRFAELHGDIPERWYASVLSRLQDQGLLELREDSWRLTRRGMDIQNSVLLEFLET